MDHAAAVKIGIHAEIVMLMPALKQFAMRFERSANDAEDLAHDAILKALANSHQFRPGTSLKSWLFTIIRNIYCSKYRIDKRYTLYGDAETATSHQPTPPTQEWTIRAVEVAKAISRLEPERRALLIMAIRGDSYERIAEVCGCELGTIKSRLARARASLMQSLGETNFSDAAQAN